jgi:hypothetical protein
LFSDSLEVSGLKKSGKGKERELPLMEGSTIHIPHSYFPHKGPISREVISDKASVASDKLSYPVVERFDAVLVPRPLLVIRKKSSCQMSDSSVEEVLGFKCAQVSSLVSMPPVATSVLCPGDSYEVARLLSIEAGRLVAEAACLIGEAEIVRVRYDRMMAYLRLAEQ